MSEHRTNELLPPLGVWALRGGRLIFVTRVNTTQSVIGSWFLPALLATDTPPGDEAGEMESTSVGRSAFCSTNWVIFFCSGFGEAQPLPGLSGLHIDTRDTYFCAEETWVQPALYRRDCTTRSWLWNPASPWLAVASSAPGSTRVLTSPAGSQLTCPLLFFLLLFFFSFNAPLDSRVSKGT